ncbi:MAG: hypothetical protein U0939_07590 [Pirellulales bacterium]
MKSFGRPAWSGAFVCAWLAAAVVVLCVEWPRAGHTADGARDLQRILGGLGLGSQRHLGRCSDAFDPRLGRSCPECTRRTLLGRAVCPVHSLQLSATR